MHPREDEHKTIETLALPKAFCGALTLQVQEGLIEILWIIFRAHILMRMKGVRSLREMTRLLDNDPWLRKLCLIKHCETDYPRSVLSRFTTKVGESNLNKIIDEKVVKVLRNNQTRKVDAVLNTSFIKTWAHQIQLTTKLDILMRMQGLTEQTAL